MGSDYDDLPQGSLLRELIADREITSKTESARRQAWAKAWVEIHGGSASTYRTSGTNLARWKKDDDRRPRNNPKNETLLLAVLGLGSREELGQAILQLQKKKDRASVAGEVAESVRRYDDPGPLRKLAERLYLEGGYAERLQELEQPARKLIESCWIETAARAAEADRLFALLKLLLDSRKKE